MGAFHPTDEGNAQMQGRKSYTQDELDRARSVLDEQLGAYDRLAKAVDAGGDDDARAALDAFEPRFFNSLALALDRFFVHRLRSVTGKDGNALNELELIADSLIANEGRLGTNNVIRYEPREAVLELEPGERIELRADGFARLAGAFTSEIDEKFV
jgi:hypothetical protein